jgi:histone deacetylase 6
MTEVAVHDVNDVDALADALAAGVTLSTPSRRTPARALAHPDASVGKVGLCYSDIMELHAGPSHHFERPARHAETVERFKRRGLELRCVSIEAREATDAELLLVHSQTHLNAVRTTFDASSPLEVQGEGDIYWTKHTDRCARFAAGSATAAALAVASGAMHRAFAVVRPPGHHAECARAMGFCFFNNTVVAARAALAAHPGTIKRVLLVDWDVHHGNGIQDVTYEDDAIMYVSLHRRQEGFYPETGDAEEIGVGRGRGFNVNVPWPEKGLSDADYVAAFDLLIEPVATAFAPDLVIVAAGYDAAEGDPLGGMRVSDQGYALMTERLTKLADGKLVCALEGGYGLTATANAAAATLSAMLGFKTPPLGSRRRPRRSTVELLWKMCEGELAECWPVLRSPEHVEKLRDAARAARGATAKESSASGHEEPAGKESLFRAGAKGVASKASPTARPTVTAVPVPATPLRRAATPT